MLEPENLFMDVQQKLIDECIGGNRRAEYELYKTVFSYLMSICIRYTRNEMKAKEILNMGFLKIITNLSKYNQQTPFKPWARKVMINTLINEYKREKRHHENIEYVEDYFDNEQYSDINEALVKFDGQQVYNFIAQLPDVNRQVFNLYFIDGYKHKEIAEMLGMSEGTSKWHINSAKEKLRELILKKNDILKHPTYHE